MSEYQVIGTFRGMQVAEESGFFLIRNLVAKVEWARNWTRVTDPQTRERIKQELAGE